MHLIITLTGKIGNGNKSYFCTTFCGLHNFAKKVFALPGDDIAVWRARSSSWLGDWSSRRTKHHTPEMWRWWRQLRCCGPARYWGHFAKQSSGGVTQHRSGEAATVSGMWQHRDQCRHVHTSPELLQVIVFVIFWCWSMSVNYILVIKFSCLFLFVILWFFTFFTVPFFSLAWPCSVWLKAPWTAAASGTEVLVWSL